MVRHLRRLMRPISVGNTPALALAVYRVRRNNRWCSTPAKETGYEGVACVDDVARAAWLFLDVWEQYALEEARSYAEGFLEFTRAMQQPDGRFANFVRNWGGRCNLSGATSYPGGPHWTARAVMALARSVAVLQKEEDLERIRRVWPHLRDTGSIHSPVVRSLHLLAALQLERATGDQEWLHDVRDWAEEILACRDGQGQLRNDPTSPSFHLWGHIQPAALALAGARLKWPQYVDAAEHSTRLVLEPIVRRGFALPQVLPYDVSSVIFSLKTLFQVTLREEYRELLHLARAWFRGRNLAGQPVYDAYRGLCHDGIDHGAVNQNSGAESNIEGAFALMEELPWPLLVGRYGPLRSNGDDAEARGMISQLVNE